MSLYGSPEGFREVLSVLLGVLLEHSTGLKVKELREVLKRAHRIDLEELRKDLGFGNIIGFLAELPGCRLIHPERHGDCVVQYAPETGKADPFYSRQRFEEECWFEDTLPDSFLPSPPPTQQQQASTEKLSLGQLQKATASPVQEQKAPSTTGMDRTSAQPSSSTPPKERHVGKADPFYSRQRFEEECWFEDTLPDSFLPSPPPTQQHQASTEKLSLGQLQKATASPVQEQKAPSTTGMDRTSAQPSSSTPPRERHVGSQEEPDGVYPGRNLPIPTSTPDKACSSLEAPPRRTAVTATPESHHQRRPPGLDEEILCVLTQPMFACGLRVQKLTEILSVERGIDLDDLSWGLGHQDTVDFLQHVPNVEVLDPTKGEDCVVIYQPGFRRKDGRLIPCGLPLTSIATLDRKLRTEFEDSQSSGVSHSFLYPVPSNSSQRQIQNRGNSTSKHFPKPGSGHPSTNNRNAPGTVYMSKHPQKPGLPQQPRTPGMAMVFRASKTTHYVGPQHSFQRKTPATQNVNRTPSQKSKVGPLEAYPTPAYPTSISPGQQTYQTLPKHMPTGPSQGYAPATTSPYASSQAINSDKDLDPVLMDEILVVLLQQPRGVGFGEFAGLFHRTHGYQFKLCRHGFTTLRALLDEMTDLVYVSEDPTDPLITCKGCHHYVFIGGGPFSSRI